MLLVIVLASFVATAAGEDATAKTSSYVFNDGSHYPISEDDWGGISDTHAARALPQGCKCVESGKTTGCKFDCTCTCNLTPDQCDANCCCDPDCSPAEVATFKSAHSFCIDTTTTILQVSKCMSTDSVLAINPSYGLREYNPADGVSGVLCVVRDNNPTKGDFYSVVTTPQPETILDSSNVKRSYSFVKTRVSSEGYNQVGYVAGNRIQAAFPNAQADLVGYAAFGGFMPLPTAGMNGQCTTQNPMRFQTPVTENKCTQTSTPGTVLELEAKCESMFSFQHLVGQGNDLYVKKSFSTTMSVGVAATASLYTPVSVGSVTYKDMTSGVKHSKNIRLENGATTFWDPVSKVCQNALVSVHYRVTYAPRKNSMETVDGTETEVQSGGTIESIQANIVVANITAFGSGNNQYFNLQQEYLVDFMKIGIVRPRSRSGMPGYINGLPVLAGTLQTNGAIGADTPKEAIDQTIDGLRIPFFANDRGECLPDLSNQLDVDSHAGELVLFRQEFMKSCSLQVTLAELETMCIKDPASVTKTDVSTYGIYLNSTGIQRRIGVYGNANYTNTDLTEWLEMKVNKPVGQGTFQKNVMECKTLITSMNVEFLYANAGAYLNPQPKIVAARVSFGREDVRFISNGNPTASGEKMNLVLSTSVTFVHLGDEALEEYVPPAPPLLPEIPYDIFYPFLLSEGQRNSFVSSWTFIVVTVVCAFLTQR